MPVELWIGLGLGVWALAALLLTSSGRRDRDAAARTLATLGLNVTDDAPANPSTMRGPRRFADGSYRGLPVVLEDYLARRPDGSTWPHTRVRTTARVQAPDFALSAVEFDAVERTVPATLHTITLGPPLDARLRAAVADEDGEAWVRSGCAAPEVLAAAMARGRGQLQEIVSRDGQLSVLMAGMGLDADQVRPVLDALVRLAGDAEG